MTNFYHTVAKMFYHWASFHCYRWPNTLKITIWSHSSQPTVPQPVTNYWQFRKTSCMACQQKKRFDHGYIKITKNVCCGFILFPSPKLIKLDSFFNKCQSCERTALTLKSDEIRGGRETLKEICMDR